MRGAAPCNTQATNSRIAWSYVRWPLADVKLLSTAAFGCSKSGTSRPRFGALLRRGVVVDLRIGRAPVRRQHLPPGSAYSVTNHAAGVASSLRGGNRPKLRYSPGLWICPRRNHATRSIEGRPERSRV